MDNKIRMVRVFDGDQMCSFYAANKHFIVDIILCVEHSRFFAAPEHAPCRVTDHK
jgi:hypothetical protein